jgi:hypothetical protein
MNYEPMNEWMSHGCHIFQEICVSNVFSMNDISAWNVRIMIEPILHDFHY